MTIIIDSGQCIAPVDKLVLKDEKQKNRWAHLRAQCKASDGLSIERAADLYEFLDDTAKNLPLGNSKERITVEQAKQSVIKSINQSLKPSKPTAKKQASKRRRIFRRLGFALLFTIGSLYAAADGITGIFSVLTVIPGITGSVLMGPGILFALIAIFIYWGFDLKKVSKAEKIRFMHIPSYMNAYLGQSVAMNKAYKIMLEKMNSLAARQDEQSTLELEVLNGYQQTYQRINSRLEARRDYAKNHVKESRRSRMVKYGVSGLAAMLYASGGFFIGQGLVSYILPLWTTIALTSPLGLGLTVGIGCVCAVVGLISYLYMERKSIFSLVRNLSGLPEKSYDKFCAGGKAIKDKAVTLSSMIKLKQDNVRTKQALVAATNPKNAPSSETAQVFTWDREIKANHAKLKKCSDSPLMPLKPYQATYQSYKKYKHQEHVDLDQMVKRQKQVLTSQAKLLGEHGIYSSAKSRMPSADLPPPATALNATNNGNMSSIF